MSWALLKQRRKEKAEKAPRKPKKVDDAYIQALAARGCDGCPLNKAKLESPKMEPTGAAPADTRIYVLGEAPGREEDERGEQFVGVSGRLLRKQIPEALEDQVRWNNVIRCRPPNNREPSALEIACCREQQEKDIAKSKPRIILGFGNIPLSWMLGGSEKKISAWRGRLIPVKIRGHTAWFMPSLHPSYILRTQHQREKAGDAIEETFRRDLRTAFVRRDKPPTVEDPKEKDKGVVILPAKADAILEALEEAKSWEQYGADIETNGLRPYKDKAKILSIAISNYDKTFAIPLRHRQAKWSGNELQQVEDALVDFFLAGGLPVAHNSKFEQEWLAFFFGARIVHEVQWQDTMAQAYVLDERPGAKSLEAVSLISIGMNVKALRTRKRHTVNTEALDDESLDDVLDYNAYDAKYELPIFYEQLGRLEAEGLVDVYSMMNERAGPFALAQIAGMYPDVEAARRLNAEYEVKIAEIEETIQKHKDVIKFARHSGEFLPSSNPNILELFYRQLGFKECEVKTDKRTGKVTLSTDESVLSEIDHPVARNILELRRISKLCSTYLKPLLPGAKNPVVWPDGKIHTTYNHLLAVTGRTSSEDPNLQNYPSRKDRHVRQIIIARHRRKEQEQQKMVAFDYGQIEARVIAMASRCKVLVNALWEGYDIHGEWTEKVAYAYPATVGGKKFLKDKPALKKLRDKIKNGWTFPLFYGSVLRSVADNLEVPERVLSPLYDEFWERYEDVLTWQEELKKFYRRMGYVETLTHRRRRGPISANELINSPIQGTASDIVVKASVLLSRQAYKKKRPTLQWRMNVHDDLTFYLFVQTLEQDIQHISAVMVKPRYDFINVPLVVEVKTGDNWADMVEVAKISSVDFGHKRIAV